jgi:hypothetical protein
VAKAYTNTETLVVVVDYIKGVDALLTREALSEYQDKGACDCILLCGQDGEVILRTFDREGAEEFFVGERGRTLAECHTCGAHIFLSAKLKKAT